MKIIFFISILLIFSFNYAKSTSTSFDQDSIIMSKINPITKNANNSVIGLHSLVVTSSIGFFGKHLYEAGFFSPLGLVPNNITDLSPLAYSHKEKYSDSLMLGSKCNNSLIYKNNLDSKLIFKESIEDNLGLDCTQMMKKVRRNSFNSLIDRYFK